MNLMIIALNTFALSPRATADPTLIADQFTWFDAQLAQARAAGQEGVAADACASGRG